MENKSEPGEVKGTLSKSQKRNHCICKIILNFSLNDPACQRAGTYWVFEFGKGFLEFSQVPSSRSSF